MEILSGHFLKSTMQQVRLLISNVSSKTNETLSCSKHCLSWLKENTDQQARERNRI